MVHEPAWRSRIAEQVPDLSVLRQPERELVALLAATPESVVTGDLLNQVDGEHRVMLAALLDDTWGAMDVDALVAGAVNKLSSRKLEAELKDLERRLPLTPEDEKPVLMNRHNLVRAQIAALNSGRWSTINRGGRVGS